MISSSLESSGRTRRSSAIAGWGRLVSMTRELSEMTVADRASRLSDSWAGRRWQKAVSSSRDTLQTFLDRNIESSVDGNGWVLQGSLTQRVPAPCRGEPAVRLCYLSGVPG